MEELEGEQVPVSAYQRDTREMYGPHNGLHALAACLACPLICLVMLGITDWEWSAAEVIME